MRSTTLSMEVHLQGELTSLATCWHVTLLDGTELGFTDHDADITVAGLVYLAASGYTATAIETTGALNVDNMDVEGMLEAPSISEDDLSTGKWDHAAIEIFMVDWNHPDAGRLVQRKGTLGEINGEGTRFKAEIRGLMQALQSSIGQIYQPACRADFGDAKCKFDVSTVTTLCTVTTVSADGRTINAGELVLPAGQYTGGKITFVTGPNAGISAEIKSNDVGFVTLQLPTPYPPVAGDTFNAVRGCLKRFAEDCRDTYDNAINFRGEPHLPGMNKIMQQPPFHP
jgi:uncharacterized phage protein (TIGR02218 family)